VTLSGRLARLGLLQPADDIVNRDVHCVGGELFPTDMTRRIHHENGMAVHRAHVHPARKMKDTERGTPGMIAVLNDRKCQLELAGERLRLRNGIDADGDHLATKVLDLRQPRLQLHELLLAGPSTRFFIKVDHHLRAAKLSERKRLARRGRLPGGRSRAAEGDT
jgi:hypothetical protein